MTKNEIQMTLDCLKETLQMELSCPEGCRNIHLCADLSKYLGREGEDVND